ncbi:thioredoxin [Treponema sp.]
MSAEITLTSLNYEEEVLKSTIPVLVDFWAEWCMPCKMISPILEQIATEYEGKVKVAKVNVDQEGELAGQFNVVSIPTIILFKDGKVLRQKVGAIPKHELINLFKDLI